VLIGAFTGRLGEMTKELLDQAQFAVEFTVRLVGVMAFFLGLMNVAREGGLLAWLARRLAPLLRRMFPDVPRDHPAMSAIVLNMAANMLGLGNAATPFGIKAMSELERLNPRPGVATDSMALFLAINTSAVTLLPTGVIGVRAALGSEAAAAIWIPTLIATSASTLAALSAWWLLRRFWRGRPLPAVAPEAEDPGDAGGEQAPSVPDTPPVPERRGPASRGAKVLIGGFVAALGVALVLHVRRELDGAGAWEVTQGILETWLLPLLIAGLLLVGLAGRVKVYESAVAGAREAIDVGVRIVPFLVAILTAVAMFRASGALDLLIAGLDPLTGALGLPAEALPMALLRPLSGSGAFGVMTEIMETQGPDSFVGMLVSTFQGSTETTFYVLAVYFGAARIRAGRYTLGACLAGDVAGIAAATAACHLFFGAA